MATEKSTNYTPEQEQELVRMYNSGEYTTEQLAEHFEKSVRSITAKLARLGVYKSKTSKEPPKPKKADIVTQVEELLNLEFGTLNTVEKADKVALLALLAAIEGLKIQS